MKDQRIVHGIGLKEVIRDELTGAFTKRGIRASEMSEFYLVNLLTEFHTRTENVRAEASIEKPLALLLMEAGQAPVAERPALFKDLGDHALVVAGFFAESIKRTLVDISYYMSIGGSAYTELSILLSGQKTFPELYAELADKFEDFAEAISIVAPWNRASSDVELLKIYERWLSTGDLHLKEVLEKSGISTDA